MAPTMRGARTFGRNNEISKDFYPQQGEEQGLLLEGKELCAKNGMDRVFCYEQQRDNEFYDTLCASFPVLVQSAQSM